VSSPSSFGSRSRPPSVVAHLALAVVDQERSRRFYERYFGFDAEPSRFAEDRVLLLQNAEGFLLALGETDEPIRLPRFLHFGFAPARDPDQVRAFRNRLVREGIRLVEEWDDGTYVSVKRRDPDGYVVEFAWEWDRARPDERGPEDLSASRIWPRTAE
jgi:catechol 2,3-dioxygenase-like lactoylglutathione lyase family enzyme